MKTSLLIFFVSVSYLSFSQENTCYKFLGKAEQYPMQSAAIYGHRVCESVIADDEYKIIACSKNPEVFAITAGKIISIFAIDTTNFYKTVLIEGIDNYYYAYYYTFDTIVVKKGENIRMGSILGKAKFSYDMDQFAIMIQIGRKDEGFIKENKIWELIQQANKDSSVAVCDATVLK